MSISLVDALQQVHLEAGHIYQCHVGKLRIHVHVEEYALDFLPVPLKPTDVMLDPWTDLPAPQAVSVVDVMRAAPMIPDVPEIPIDWRQT